MLQLRADTVNDFLDELCTERQFVSVGRARYLRQSDRQKHADNYPSLSYPELYLLEGGYKAFYEQHGRLCSPRDYVPMLQRGFEQSLRQYRAECKRDSRRLKQNGKRWLSDGSQPRILRF